MKSPVFEQIKDIMKGKNRFQVLTKIKLHINQRIANANQYSNMQWFMIYEKNFLI